LRSVYVGKLKKGVKVPQCLSLLKAHSLLCGARNWREVGLSEEGRKAGRPADNARTAGDFFGGKGTKNISCGFARKGGEQTDTCSNLAARRPKMGLCRTSSAQAISQGSGGVRTEDVVARAH